MIEASNLRSLLLAFVSAAVLYAPTSQMQIPHKWGTPPLEKVRNDYYVSTIGDDSGDGSASHPWRTIGHASLLARPGMTIHVAPGTYYGNLVTNVSGSASARITYLSDTKWGAKIVGSGTGVLWALDASYIDVIGFDISGPNAAGIFIGWSGLGAVGHNRLLYNYVHDLKVSGGCNSTGGSALDTGQSTSLGDNQIVGNRIANIGAAMMGTCRTVQGIYIATANDLIANNLVSGVAKGGIQQWHGATASTIVNNTVFHCTVGIIMGDGDDGALPGGSSDNLVANNSLVDNKYGISEIGEMGAGNSYLNNLVFNNQVQNLKISSATPTGTVNADPQFADYRADGSGDYHLGPRSPAIDKGTVIRAAGRDYDGGIRPIGAGWDIGAYEAGTTPARWPWFEDSARAKKARKNTTQRQGG